MKRSNHRRAALATRLGELCTPILTLTDRKTGWPAEATVTVHRGILPVACYMGLIGRSHRGRDHVERRMQNPGKGRPLLLGDGRLPILLGIWTEAETTVLVGMDARRHLAMRTRKSLFVPLDTLRVAQEAGWAEHVSASGERIVCFWPARLVDYVETRLEELDGCLGS
jgi:hypothetical protein